MLPTVNEAAHRDPSGCETAPDLNLAKISYREVQPSPDLFPNFAAGARFGVFLVPFLVLSLLFCCRSVRQVCCDHPGVAVQPGHLPIWLLSVPVLALWTLVTLGWPYSAHWLMQDGAGDPMALFEGISVWPSIALRAAGSVLSIFLAWYALRSLELNRLETLGEMGVPRLAPTFRQAVAALPRKAAIPSLLWFPPPPDTSGAAPKDGDERPRVKFKKLKVGASDRWWARCLRAAGAVAAMMVLWIVVLQPIFGGLAVPARGSRAQAIYFSVSLLNVLATLFLTFLVVDANIYSRTFIKRLTAVHTIWPGNTRKQVRQKLGVADDDDLGDWLNMEFMAQRTRSITQLIYFPFIAIAMLVFSRSPIFDNFSLSWTVIIAQGLALCAVIGSVVAYRSTAENARSVALKHLGERIIAAEGSGNEAKAAQLRDLLAGIQVISKGAFAPWSSQPIVKAVLVPLLTYGGTSLLHIYGLPGS